MYYHYSNIEQIDKNNEQMDINKEEIENIEVE